MLPSRRRDPERQLRANTEQSGTGPLGEDLAARWLAARGFRIEERNLRTRFGEIDLLIRRRRLWIAVEVKTRRFHPAPERTVSGSQRARIRAAIDALAPRLRPSPRELREDVVAVTIRPDRTAEIRLFAGRSRPWGA
jgi:putative endonuclease